MDRVSIITSVHAFLLCKLKLSFLLETTVILIPSYLSGRISNIPEDKDKTNINTLNSIFIAKNARYEKCRTQVRARARVVVMRVATNLATINMDACGE